MSRFLLSFLLLFSSLQFQVHAQVPAQAGVLSEKIHQAALAALDPQNLRKDTSPHTLYGQPINTKDLAYGWLACARVVSAVLKVTGIKIPRYDSRGKETAGVAMAVYEVEKKLSSLGWQVIRKEADLRNGDVIVWRSKSNSNKGYFCSGNGNCHIGIVTANGAFNNHILWGSPAFTKVNLGEGYPFKVGFRAP